MTVWIESKRALSVFAISASACAVYGSDLVSSPGGLAGSAGAPGGMAGAGAQGAAMPVGGGGDAVAGGIGMAGSPEGGKPDVPETVPYLTVAIDSPSVSVPLTSEGSIDWAHWGLGSATGYNHKAEGTSQLVDFKPTGSAPAVRYLDGPVTIIWSDGTPTASATTNDGIAYRGVGEGVALKVSAAIEVRTLRLYLGVYHATGQIKAALSDPRSNSIGDDRFSSKDAAWVLQVVNIEFGNADKPDTTIDISWSVESAPGVDGAVSITAISLGKG